jgi:hypothetical protein
LGFSTLGLSVAKITRERRVHHQTRSLLDVIVSTLVVVDEQTDIDLNAAASETAAAMDAEKSAALQRESDRADALAPAFDAGLRVAWAAHLAGQEEIALDDRDPGQNAMADALIQYLVSYDLAESGAVETAPMHYVYTVKVDWNGLDKLASNAGIDLSSMLA